MTPSSKWRALLEIAKADHAIFLRVSEMPDIPLALSCFHAQQAAEKYLKVFLIFKEIDYDYTHDLVELNDAIIKHNIPTHFPQEMLAKLNPFAVQTRYDLPPEISVTREEVKEIVDLIANWCQKEIHD